MKNVAAFDLDHTLTDRDCLIRFFWFIRSRGVPLNYVSALKKLGFSRRSVKVALCQLLEGVSVSTLDEHAEIFFRDFAIHWLRPDTVRALRNHQQSGDHVVIVSASLSFYVKKFAEFMDADYLSTDLIQRGEVVTGVIDGRNVRGSEKVVRLQRWLSAQGLSRNEIHVTAYGDSSGDAEMLRWADNPVWVK